MDILDRLKQGLGDRYTIEREIGSGGMATVYLADDVKHHRQVAIKVLRPELSESLGADRFLREIEIAAGLTHPHILTLIDSGEAKGLLYYVMPFVAGESLRAKLAREGELPVADAVKILREVADALAYAHERGLVHRDIKPDNVLLAGHHAVVADFGVAKAVSEATGREKLTTAGVALGTPSYMAPEQAVADPHIDHRADIYAVGVLAYEMLTGRTPFTAPTAQAMLAAHVTDAPDPVQKHRESVPAALAELIDRCLAKKPADRWQSAAELLPQLEALGTPSAGITPTTTRPIQVTGFPRRNKAFAGGAVLAVVALAGAFAFFQRGAPAPPVSGPTPVLSEFELPDWILVAEFEGPAEEPTIGSTVRDLVMAALDQSTVVATVPLTQIRTALRSAGLPDSARLDDQLAQEIALRYSIGTYMLGRVSRLGSGYSSVVRLLNAEDGSSILSLTETAANADDLIPSLDRLVRNIREGIGEQQDIIGTNRPLTLVTTPSFEAYRKYREARTLQLDDREASNGPLLEALAIDPEFAMAWRMLAANLSAINLDDSAKGAMDRALKLRDRVSATERLHIEALNAGIDDDNEAALEAYDRIIELNPRDVVAHYNRSLMLGRLGRYSDAVENYEWEEALSPLGVRPSRRRAHFNILLAMGRTSDADARTDSLPDPDEGRTLMAMARKEWAVADSIAVSIQNRPSGDGSFRAAEALMAARAAQGRIHWVDSTAAERGVRAYAQTHMTLLTLGLGCMSWLEAPIPWPEERDGLRLVDAAIWATIVGDTTTHAAVLEMLSAQETIDEHFIPGVGSVNPPHFTATIVDRALADRDDRRVLEELRAIAWDGEAWMTPRTMLVLQWVAADMYERLGHADTAALYFERLADSTTHFGNSEILHDRGYVHSFAYRRLARLHARLGNSSQATRYWEMFLTSFADADPELRWMVDQSPFDGESTIEDDERRAEESCRSYAGRREAAMRAALDEVKAAQDAHFTEHGTYGAGTIARDLELVSMFFLDATNFERLSRSGTLPGFSGWIRLGTLAGNSTGWSATFWSNTIERRWCALTAGEGVATLPELEAEATVCGVGDPPAPASIHDTTATSRELERGLRELAALQERFHADEGEYGDFDELEEQLSYSPDFRVETIYASLVGWVGGAFRGDTPTAICHIYVGPPILRLHPAYAPPGEPICMKIEPLGR